MPTNHIVSVKVAPRSGSSVLLAPAGLSSPHGFCTGVEVIGATWHPKSETHTGQPVYVIDMGDQPVEIRYSFADHAADYPDSMYRPHDSRYTRAADALRADAGGFADAPDPAQAVVDHVAGLFSYGHVADKFYDGHDQIPHLCDVTKGSCVDINAYLMASLRAAGVEAGYVAGAFFPAEKTSADGASHCDDMHCWVVTRDQHGEREWDIAHHLKAGKSPVAAHPNPRGGKRFALSHSMGWDIAAVGVVDAKLMSDPVWVVDGSCDIAEAEIRLEPNKES